MTLHMISIALRVCSLLHLARHPSLTADQSRVQYGSTDVLDALLEREGCDVDLQNRLLKATPLHLAVKLDDLDTRHYVVQTLLDAGADTK